jgi:murein DD-endopeptidase MepM/ murein hydrolase activator NlpD
MKKLSLILLIAIIASCNFKQSGIIPVKNATSKDWNPHSFWYSPWGKSGVHKGIDIFAKSGTPVLSSVGGLVVFTGDIDMGGKVVAVLSPQWQIHYYAHLQEINTRCLSWASQGEEIGKVGDSGNAAGKPPHLHYSVVSLTPKPTNITTELQGWKRMFYLNPQDHFN